MTKALPLLGRNFALVAAFLSLVVSTVFAASSNEELDFRLETDWKLANSAKGAKHSSIAEYVRERDDINNWKELVTIQTFGKSSRDSSPEQALKTLQTIREKECPGTTQWNVIERDANSILYESQAKPCLGWPEQCEIARIIDGNHFRFILHYAVKVYSLPSEERSNWIRKFSHASIVGKH